jgi:hypothetical protein
MEGGCGLRFLWIENIGRNPGPGLDGTKWIVGFTGKESFNFFYALDQVGRRILLYRVETHPVWVWPGLLVPCGAAPSKVSLSQGTGKLGGLDGPVFSESVLSSAHNGSLLIVDVSKITRQEPKYGGGSLGLDIPGRYVHER